MNIEGWEKRRHPRIKIPYMMKFRVANRKRWDAVKPINLSESGIYFLTTEEFSVGADIEFYVSNPTNGEKMECNCKVLRCGKSEERALFYETVVGIEYMSDEARGIYQKMLRAFSNEIARKQYGM